MAVPLGEKYSPLLGTAYIYPPGLLESPGTGRGRASAAPLSRERSRLWARAGHAAARHAGLDARAREGPLASGTSKVVVNLFHVAIEVPGFTRRDLTP